MILEEFLTLLTTPTVLSLIENEIKIVVAHNPHIFGTETAQVASTVASVVANAVQNHANSVAASVAE